MQYTPNRITTLKANEVFVFGSNEAGKHGAGAARQALLQFGAKYGEPEGLFGQSYAIPTKNKQIGFMTVDQIKPYVDRFIEFAKARPDLTFLVTEIGCGLAGLTPAQVGPLFKEAQGLENVVLPESFVG